MGSTLDVEAWCTARGWRFKTTHEHDGFVIEEPAGDWRLEWGPATRRYLGTHELRLRADTGIDAQTYGVLMPRSLMQALERELFDAYVEGKETRADDALPEEVRWLAIAPKLGAAELGVLRETVGGVGNVLPWMAHWLAGAAGADVLRWMDPPGPGPAPLFALCVSRGRLVLRLGMPRPEVEAMAQAQALFQTLLVGARAFAAPLQPPDPSA